nr:MAG TPA: hypothetical protein [Caudoviricetes sp.]
MYKIHTKVNQFLFYFRHAQSPEEPRSLYG